VAISFFQFAVEGKPALGFDTGLDAQAFAQAKMAQFITQPGLVVFPGGTIEDWKASGVVEYPEPESPGAGGSRMAIWGPPFAGERLDLLVEDGSRKDYALRAIRFWLEARLVLGNRELSFRPGGAFVSPAGAVFFPPEGLVSRCLHAEGDAAWLWGSEACVHPDLTGKEAAAFTAAALLYRVFAGSPAFTGKDAEALHQNIREGVFLPVNMAAPGLDETAAALINAALAGRKDGGEERRPDPARLLDALKPLREASPESASGAAMFFHSLPEGERKRINEAAARFWKKKTAAVQTRRFVIRNLAVIAGFAAAALIAVLAGRNIAQSRASLPTTAGMDSAQVVRAYYGAFGALDHQMMEAAVIQKAGKADIEMVVNFFVVSKVREAYEPARSPFIPAQEWRDAGSPPSAVPVFGVSDLEIAKISGGEAEEETRYRSSFILWVPAAAGEGEESPAATEAENPGPPPEAPALPYLYTDELTLIRHKGNWRIAEIKRRETNPGGS
jgi:hypothetical protein